MTVTSTPLVPVIGFGDRFRIIRRELGLSQTELAHRLGVNQTQLAGWELGKNKPRDVVGVAQAVEREFGYSATWLLDLRPAAQLEPAHLRSVESVGDQQTTLYAPIRVNIHRDDFGLAA